jgi:hypothetical protein
MPKKNTIAHSEFAVRKRKKPRRVSLMLDIEFDDDDESPIAPDSPPGDGFQTNHLLKLTSSLVGVKSVFTLFVDKSTLIDLTEKEYSFIKKLMSQMHADAKDSACSNSELGFVTSADLTSEPFSSLPPSKGDSTIKFAPDDLGKGVLLLRRKLKKHGISEHLIETGKRGTHSYRISTAASNLLVDM